MKQVSKILQDAGVDAEQVYGQCCKGGSMQMDEFDAMVGDLTEDAYKKEEIRDVF